jgi:hypothetical protein
MNIPPPPPINALVTPLGMMHFGCSLHVLVHTAMHLQLSIISTSPNASVIMVQVILLVIKSYGLLQQKMMGKCCLSIFDFISKNVVVFQKGFFGQDLRNLITRQEFPMRNLLRQRKCSGEPIACTLCIYAVISKCVKTLFFGTSPVALGLKKYLWFRFPFDPIFFCRDPIFSGWLRAAHTACQNSVCCHTNY